MSEGAPPSSGQRIDVASLLTIDVESELRKLTQAQLQGPWQLPAELVRRALRDGARRVEVELGRQQLRVRSEGGAVPFAVLRELAALLDGSRSPERRHRALSALERAGALALLGLAGLEASELEVVCPPPSGSDAPYGLRWRRGGAAELVRLRSVPAHAEVVLRGARLDRGRAREWLSEVASHAPVPIILDGRSLPRGFRGALSTTALEGALPGQLAIPREGEVARLLLLQHGLLSAHLSLTDAPCFEAAIETRDLFAPGRSPSAAELRERAGAQLEAVVAAAVDHLIELGRDGAGLPAEDRRRVTQQLLRAARGRRDQARTIARLPLFRGLERDGRERWYDLLALRQSVQLEQGERLLSALFPDQDAADFAPEGRVYVLDESERALLGELLELGFRQPRRKVSRRRGLARLLREGPGLGRGRDLLLALRPGGRPLLDARLDPGERQLLVQLRAQVESCEVHMCTGRGPVRRVGAGPDKLLLPRESPLVRSAVAAVAHDAGWVYPALLALLEGRDFPARARRRWRLESWT